MADILNDLEAIGINIAEAMPRFGGSREMYLKYILKLPEDKAMANYKSALAAEDMDSAEGYIHEFKGTSGTLGVTELFRMSSDIMATFRAKDFESIPAKNQSLFVEYDRVSSEIIKCREQQ